MRGSAALIQPDPSGTNLSRRKKLNKDYKVFVTHYKIKDLALNSYCNIPSKGRHGAKIETFKADIY